jgi:hypothetical protein
MIWKWLKYVVHATLEGRWCIVKDKGNHQELIITFMSEEISFENIKLFHMNLVIAEIEIKFGKKLSAFKFIQMIINGWNGKLILDGYSVEGVKVTTHVPSAFFF